MMFRILTPILFLILLLLPQNSSAVNGDQQVQLEKIKKRIERAEKDLKDNRQSELSISRELALLKKSLQLVDLRIAELKKDQKNLRAKINQLDQLIRDSQQKSRKIMTRLEARLVALYKEGEAGPLKVLFSADSPTEMIQQYHYLTRVLEHDQALLDEYRAAYDLQKKQLTEQKLLEQQQTQLLENEQRQRQMAEDGRKLQSRLLKQARLEKTKLNQELKQLKINATKLKELITGLQKESAGQPGAVAEHFAIGRGKLRWPVKGQVIIGFGTQKDNKLGTYYESNGLEIATKLGSPIQAVAAGKVVFADYFKGYGNLYILSHSGGYHSLYAQIDRMQKKLGDQVSSGDLLGYSGLAGRDSMYFEIRSKGSPVNPLSWLIKQ